MVDGMKKKFSKGSRVTLNRREQDIWVKRTPDELEELRARDVAAGRWCDDGGEPILYGSYSGWNVTELAFLEVTVTSLRPTWLGWHKRPKHLVAGFSEVLGREVLFKKPV